MKLTVPNVHVSGFSQVSDTTLSSLLFLRVLSLFLQSIVCSGPKSVSSMSTQLSEFLGAFVSLENVSHFSETTKDHKYETVCKIVMIMAVCAHIKVHFLPGKVLVTQVLAL